MKVYLESQQNEQDLPNADGHIYSGPDLAGTVPLMRVNMYLCVFGLLIRLHSFSFARFMTV